MGVASFSVSVSPEMLTALLAARATVSSLPPAGVVLTVKADLSGTHVATSSFESEPLAYAAWRVGPPGSNANCGAPVTVTGAVNVTLNVIASPAS